jgi:hypothetical protein
MYPTNGITGATEAEGADNLAHYAICDDAIVDRRRVPKIILDGAAIKRRSSRHALLKNHLKPAFAGAVEWQITTGDEAATMPLLGHICGPRRQHIGRRQAPPLPCPAP